MSAQPQKKYTPEEYLELEREATYKSEYFRGEIFAMAGATRNHNRIVANLTGECYIHLKGKTCRTYSSDQRIHIPENGLYTYPDLLAVCGRDQLLDEHKDTILNPRLIVEVLSEGTEAYDRGEKFQLYRSIPTLQEYVLINSRRVAAEVFRKNEEGLWTLASEAFDGEGSIEIASIGLTLTVRAIYDQTEGLLAEAS
jgi:Uma2 family endonuclease